MDGCQNRAATSWEAGSQHVSGDARWAPSISLVLPAYNEQETIVQAVCEADDALSRLAHDYEILVVDDGSTDATAELVEAAAASRGHVRLLRQPRNMGYGAALRRGFAEARCDLVGFTDSDCQFHVHELERLALLARDYDIACGYRIDRQDPFLRCFYSKVYNLLVQALFGTGVRDVDCALKLFRRETLQTITITTDGYLVNTEMLTRARQQERTIVEVGVTHRPRAAGESKVSVMHIFPVLLAMVRFWWNFVMFPHREAESPVGGRSRLSTWHLAAIGGLGAVAAAIWFGNLGYQLIEPDETRYAQIALEMYQTGDWTVPRLQGEPYLDKPPLLYWATAVSYRLFGADQQSARLPNALSMLAAVVAVYVLGRRLVGDRAAAMGALATMFTVGVAISARFLLLDSMLTLWTTVTLLCAGIALVQERRSWIWWLSAGVACGLGVMTKGPVAVVICLPPMMAAVWLRGERLTAYWRQWLMVLTPGVLLAAPWFWAVIQQQPEFAEYFFWRHHITRFVQGLNHEQPFWYYLPVIAIGMFPCSLFLPALLHYLFSRREALRSCRTRELGFLMMAGIWPLVFFSASSCKLPSYILPAIPMLCLGIGKMLADTVWARQPLAFFCRYSDRAVAVATFLMLLSCIVAGVISSVFGRSGSYDQLLSVAFITLPVLWFIGYLWSGRRLLQPSWSVALAVALISATYGFNFVLAEFADWRCVADNAAQVHEEQGEATPIVYFGRSPAATSFSIKSATIVHFDDDQIDELQRFIAKQPLAIVVTDRRDVVSLRAASGRDFDLEASGNSGCVFISRGKLPLTATRPNPAATLR
jgi:4-amino-4-deoxy-L-arabinose transferase-like glycosyltransferase